MLDPAGMTITETVSAVERPRLIAATRPIGTCQLLVQVLGQQLERAGDESCRDHKTELRTGVLAGRVTVCFRGWTCRGFTDVG